MHKQSGPIYETIVVVNSATIVAARDYLERFKREHAGDVGVVDLRVFEQADSASLTLQIAFDDNEVLDAFLSGTASVLNAELRELTQSEVGPYARVLREQESSNLPSDTTCRNCGTSLRGQYCGQCGQRSRSRLISLWELVRDAFGDLFELDSRLWQTIVPLMIRPGRLTADYLQGKRARFMPPFRMYLVLSLLFFVVAFFNPNEDLALFYADTSDTAESATPEAENDDLASTEEQVSSEEGSGPRFNITVGEDAELSADDDCEMDADAIEGMPEWLQQRLTPRRLKHICLQTSADDGEQLMEKLLDNIPAALILLLPLMAFVLKLLYPLSRRYYVEHVLFFVHFHAFFFLILSLQFLWAKSLGALGVSEGFIVLPIVVAAFYIPIYLFKAMRRVYGQGFGLTLMKYLMLVVSYISGFGIMVGGALAIAAFSI